jgi:plastocyanin domain-containing protein
MWVTTSQVVEAPKPSSASVLLNGFTHNLSHKLNGFNSPLTWGYKGFPQENTLVTTTTYNYMKTPVRFPLVNFFINYLKQKTCKVLLQREG